MAGSKVLRDGRPEEVGMDPARLQHARELARNWVAKGEVPSLQVVAARRGVIVLNEAFGVLRPGADAPPLERNSIFPIMSATKPITAAAVMCLVDDGLLGLNRPFVDYLPELDHPAVEEVLVADLLTHTSGYDDTALFEYTRARYREGPNIPPPAPGQHPDVNLSIRLAAGAPPVGKPGEALRYFNTGYHWLGDIVRRVSGKPFWQFVQERIFEPLEMRDSYLVLPPELRARRVYREAGAPATMPGFGWFRGIDSERTDEQDLGGSGAKTTARDIATFLQMLLNGGSYGDRRILSRAAVAAMTRSQTLPGIPSLLPWFNHETGARIEITLRGGPGGFGYGLFLFGDDRHAANGSLTSRGAFGHGGNGGSYFWADPESELVGVSLSVSPRFGRGEWPLMVSDLVQNLVHAAVID